MTTLTYDEAAHLLRRAGFGGTPGEIRDLVARGREGAVDYLVDYERVGNRDAEEKLSASFEFLRAVAPEQLSDGNLNETEIRAWWLSRMLLTRRPLEEKMTLFWHNHFATSLDKVPPLFMYAQNLDLRRFALARFDDLLLEISRGAAMLIWLDGVTSTRENPNENFAREIQEIYSMGTRNALTDEPNYSEDDVKEIARAFTGWRFRKKAGDSSPFAFEGFVVASEADAGPKTVYGQTANFGGEDIVTILADRRATALHLVRKIFEFFVYPLDLSSPQDRATIEKFADVYRTKDHSMRELMRAILGSDEFFGSRARFALVKSPVELVVGPMRMLSFAFTPQSLELIKTEFDGYLDRMGMSLFKPPDVFGWKLNLGFINNQSMLERLNFMDSLAYSFFISTQFLAGFTSKKPRKTVKKFLDLLGPLPLGATERETLQRHITLDFNGNPTTWTVDGGYIVIQIRGLVRIIMCLPESQVN